MALAVSLPKTVKKKWNKNKNWQHRASLVFCEDTRFVESIFVCFVSPERYYFRGDRTKAINKSYTQIFLKFLFYFMIDKSWKELIFLNKPFLSLVIIQVLENSDFSYLSLHDRLWLLRPIIYHRKRKFMLISIETRHRCLASRSRFIHGFKMFHQ